MQRSSHPELSTSIETVGPTDPGSSIPFWMRRTIRTLAQLAALLVACLLVLMAFARAGHELLNPWLFASLFAPLAVGEILREVISAAGRSLRRSDDRYLAEFERRMRGTSGDPIHPR